MGTLLRTTLRVSSWAVLTGLVALLMVAVFVPRIAGAQAYTVLSSSMEPALHPGSLVISRPTDPEEVGVGSVITFQLESGKPGLVTHRVVSQGFDGGDRAAFLTEGDANDAPDGIWVRPEQIRGTVWYEIPYVGYLSTMIPSGLRELLVAATGLGLLGYGAVMFLTTARERWRTSHA
jgi:signal peptidase